MPIKKHKNSISLRSSCSELLSFFTFNKKAHFESESKLYDCLKHAVYTVNNSATCHLTTYPYIAVHVEHGDLKALSGKKDEFEAAIQSALESCLKP